ncbi:MAG TPA: hypothetical protein VF746_31310 [Longimicrobium sp.]|jgi:hypothetical protein
MSHRRLRGLALAFVAAAGLLAATPAHACHLATGWCCVEMQGGGYYCCYFRNDVLDQSSCGALR